MAKKNTGKGAGEKSLNHQETFLHPTPMLDEPEKGPWPSFVSGLKELADMYFFETLVRIHRAGEGVAYTGLKPGEAVDPAVALADKALESGNVDKLVTVLTKTLWPTVSGNVLPKPMKIKAMLTKVLRRAENSLSPMSSLPIMRRGCTDWSKVGRPIILVKGATVIDPTTL